jgi:hypothetical protein
MNVTITLSDAEFPNDQQQLIQSALGVRDNAEFVSAMKRLFKAAALEYVNMFVEEGMPSRADEMRQDRLHLLIENYYQDHVPTESEVSAIFQLTNAQSRTLLRNTLSRYRNKIGRQITASAGDVIRVAKKSSDGTEWEMLIRSDVILEELNLTIEEKGPTLNRIRLKRGSASQYEAEEDTYNLLKREYGIP